MVGFWDPTETAGLRFEKNTKTTMAPGPGPMPLSRLLQGAWGQGAGSMTTYRAGSSPSERV
jgi:hypothetical protein